MNSLLVMGFGLLLGVLCAACVMAGAWLAFRIRREPGTGQGFFKDPKGDVFTVRDDSTTMPLFPGSEEPSQEEQKVLHRANQFLEKFNV